MDEKLLKIINTYSIRNQLRKFNEESYELIEAVRDYEEQKSACEMFCDELHCDIEREHIVEELSDCMVLLSQFKEYYHIDGKEILDIMNMKIDRQLDRIANE